MRRNASGRVLAMPVLRRLLGGWLALAATALFAAPPSAPPAGRYRCYQPPAYTVTAWFDFEADGTYRLNGAAAQRYRYDAAKSLVRWTSGDFAQSRYVGIYMPPGKAGGDEDRYTIVLATRDDARPGKAGWDRLQRCYLTMH